MTQPATTTASQVDDFRTSLDEAFEMNRTSLDVIALEQSQANASNSRTESS